MVLVLRRLKKLAGWATVLVFALFPVALMSPRDISIILGIISLVGGAKLFLVWCGLAFIVWIVRPERPAQDGGTAIPNYDLAKWEALVSFDPDIARAVEDVRPYGERWVHELAQNYLALNDKIYLERISQTIVERAILENELDRSRKKERLI